MNVGGAGTKAPRRQAAFELKGTMAPLTVMRLHTVDLMLIERQLRTKIAQRPQMFLYAPVLLDFGMLEDPGALAVAALISLMRAFKLVPIGAVNAPEGVGMTLASSGLGLLPSSTAATKLRLADEDDEAVAAELARASVNPAPRVVLPPPPPPPALRSAPVRMPTREELTPGPVTPPPTPIPAAVPRTVHGGPMVVTQAVRGGQVVYAKNNDLVVLAPVNPGAQVMADGHVHIYSTLRGRAVAGAQGLPGARIFVQKLEAELVAIADAYVMADEIPGKLRGRSVQVYLEGAECRIAPL